MVNMNYHRCGKVCWAKRSWFQFHQKFLHGNTFTLPWPEIQLKRGTYIYRKSFVVLLKTLKKSSPANLSLFTVLPYLPSPIVSSEVNSFLYFMLFLVVIQCMMLLLLLMLLL